MEPTREARPWDYGSACIQQMLDGGLEAYISSVDLSKLTADLAGRKWDRKLVQSLPAQCDPCGENGEIHTIVVNGPMFKQKVQVQVGETVVRGNFAYADILPV